MAENGNGAAPQVPQMKILGQFIRDMSFENILARKPVEGQVQPDIQVQVALDGRKGSTDGQYEVITKLNITSKNKGSDAVLFVLELEYSGLFQIENIADEQLHPYLMIECPRMLFPFVRNKMVRKVQASERVRVFKDLVQAASDEPLEDRSRMEELATIIYTGGTTGESKGVMLSHANMSYNVQQLIGWLPDLPDPGEPGVWPTPVHSPAREPRTCRFPAPPAAN